MQTKRTRGEPGEPDTQSPDRVPAEARPDATRPGSRPATAGGAPRPTPRTAGAVPTLVSNRVRSDRPPALAPVGCCEPFEIDGGGSSLAAPAKETTLAGLESKSYSRSVAATGTRVRASRLLTKTRVRRLAPKPAAVSDAHKRTRSTWRPLGDSGSDSRSRTDSSRSVAETRTLWFTKNPQVFCGRRPASRRDPHPLPVGSPRRDCETTRSLRAAGR